MLVQQPLVEYKINVVITTAGVINCKVLLQNEQFLEISRLLAKLLCFGYVLNF